jgi:hypothetical protein
MGPPLSSLLLNMKSKDMGQGLALKMNCPGYIEAVMHHRYQSFLRTTSKSTCSLPRTMSFFIYSRNLPWSVLQKSSWCPWWILIWLSFPINTPKIPVSLSSMQCPKTLYLIHKNLYFSLNCLSLCPTTWVVFFYTNIDCKQNAWAGGGERIWTKLPRKQLIG